MSSKEFKFWNYKLVGFTFIWLIVVFSYFKEPLNHLANNFSYIPLGFFAAILGNITAVGGGIIFIPAMMFIYKLDPVTALKVALVSQSFGMTSGAIAWIQRGIVPLHVLKYCVPSLLIGSGISTFVFHPSGLFVKVLFGPVSIALGLFTLWSVLRRQNNEINHIPDKANVAIIVASFLGGLITGWIAIGEGEIVASVLMIVFGVSSSISIGLGVVLLSINSIFLALAHQFFLGGLPWQIGLLTGIGTVYGARLAGFLSARFSTKILKIIFAVIAIADGTMFIFQYLLR